MVKPETSLHWKVFLFWLKNLHVLMAAEKFKNSSLEDGDTPAMTKVKVKNEPSHEIMVHFVLRKLILQTHMRSHPVGLDV